MYALKVLKKKDEPEETNFLRFQLETEILSSLNHPRVPKLVEVFSVDNNHCIVQEIIEGYPLSSLIDRGYVFSEDQVKEIVRQLLMVLKDLHCSSVPEKSVVHRDLRLSNLIMNHNRLFLIDFGFARFLDPKQFPYCPDPPIDRFLNQRKNTSMPKNKIVNDPGPRTYQSLRRDISPSSDLFGTGIIALDLFTNWVKDETDFHQPWETVLHLSPNFASFINKLLHFGNSSFISADEAISELKNI
ncbi:hypothetical protein DCMF_02475 [Candidatus Formimonas warabiya]|uniref:Protein kinase domain-containing protein n=1 Tax=Formimonas warabiya TaxID=1761012 RepID=A0A3G1KMU7_FORW1|nr:hypothetical protein DCMF_02475 [Candidatus Formimonas warabiya]